MHDPPDTGLAQVADRLDGLEVHRVAVAAPPAEALPGGVLSPDSGSENASEPTVGARSPEASGVAPAAPPSGSPLPPRSGRLLPLPKLSATELEELTETLHLRLTTELDYAPMLSSMDIALPDPPAEIPSAHTLVRQREGESRVLRFGLRRFRSQPAQLWLQGWMETGSQGRQPNPDLEEISDHVQTITASVTAMKQDLKLGDLAFQVIQVSYIDVKGALDALKGFGIYTTDDPTKLAETWKFEQLPLVVKMPSPESTQTALLGQEPSQAKGAFNLSATPSVATPLPPDPNLAPTSRILVYYHPAHAEQFSRVRKLLKETIDRPARQIFIEGMVLEISEKGLKELGVEWQFREGNFDLLMGALLPGLGNIPLDTTGRFTFDSLGNLQKNWVVKIRALVQESKAEILSRPSVLTLNNRQATIRVGTDIPIATSQEQGTLKDTSKIAFNFNYLPTGISLNIRPRIAGEDDEVSMLIDTIVSAVVPGADLEMRSASGEVLASAPTVATRRVQTYARIINNTPFIIGGLVSKDYSIIRKKVPLLGDIPFLGVAFRSKAINTAKREVIIVLTPHVLREQLSDETLGRYMPKDEDRFDEFGNLLFRDSYRIREEDMFDLSFLKANPRLKQYRQLAQEAVYADFHLAARYPFNQFVGEHIPGEEILVRRMIYEVIKRLEGKSKSWMDDRVNLDRLIYFSGQNVGGYEVQFLERLMASTGNGPTHAAFFTAHPGKALALTFRKKPEPGMTGSLTHTPVPEVRLVDCPDNRAWGEQLWTLNQPDEQGSPRFTILIHAPTDLARLRRAVMLKKIVALNGGREGVDLRKISLGKVLLISDPNPTQNHLIDAEVAEYFFQTEHYYAATGQVMERVIRDLDLELKRLASNPTKP